MADNNNVNAPMPDAEDLEFFSPGDIRNIRRDAWIIYKDGANPQGVTRGQWLDRNNGIGPTEKQFARNSYAMHASLTGNPELRKVNGDYGDHDYLPPQAFYLKTPLSEEQQRIVNSTPEKDRRKTINSFRGINFKDIAGRNGFPSELPKFVKKLEGVEAFCQTMGGGSQPCANLYEDGLRAGNAIPNIQIFKGQDLLEVAWHTKEGKGKYDGKTLDEVKAAAIAKHGEGVEVALKSNTNRTMGVEQLDGYANGAQSRWNSQVSQGRVCNKNFSHLAVVVTYGPGTTSDIYSFQWLKENKPQHPLTKGILEGKYGEHLRVIGSGNTRTSVQWGISKSPYAKKLVEDAGIPVEIAEVRPDDAWKIKAIGEYLPSVTIKLDNHREGQPPAGMDVMSSRKPEEILIANRDKNGDRTGMQMTLNEYIARGKPLPYDAAARLNVEPDRYSRASENSAISYDERPRGHPSGRGPW
ncbi:VirE2 family protein [Agrobacterium fabrum]|uniref:VirE2 family protein n=1 Tax=Agrobacterium fabrum TaxID=1176649 RepID=UPI002474BDF3|nr:VirE2 family protein [Agrobacterium fabrum]MDH6298795.1 hypothetical protein [Agrobacterium fabrum]